MIAINFTPKRTACKVTFSVPEAWAHERAAVLGTFNGWDAKAHPMKKKNGKWSATVRLKPGMEYQFRYLLDGQRWENDEAATGYVPNQFGSKDSVLITET